MSQSFLPSIKTILDPYNLPTDITLLATVEDRLNYPGRFYSFFRQGGYVSICCHWTAKPKNGADFLAITQFDAPLAILPWFIDKLNFFRKMPHEGGLPHGQIMTEKEAVASEQLAICRLANAGSPSGESGYQINNFSRENRDVSGTWQQESFSDNFLFEGGLLDTWRILANRHLRNQL